MRIGMGLVVEGQKKRAGFMADSDDNPWGPRNLLLGVKLGDPTSGLVTARRCGLLGVKVERQEEEVAQSSSVQLTKSLQEISRLRKVLHEVELQLHRNLLDQESQYLIHMDVFEEHLKCVDMLLNHFTAVLASKEHILNRLQSSSTENSLHMEAPFHKHLKGIVHSISPTLSELQMNQSCMESVTSVDLTNLRQKMGSAVECVVQCRDMYQRFHQLHTTQNQTK